MEKFIKGEVVIISFPFSDLSQTKKRPAFVISALKRNDLILSQITSNIRKDNYSITLNDDDFETGTLKQESLIRLDKLFTAEKKSILYSIGRVKKIKIDDAITKLIEIIKA